MSRKEEVVSFSGPTVVEAWACSIAVRAVLS